MSEKKNLKQALEAVDLAASDLQKIAKDIVDEKAGDMDKLIRQATNVKELSDENVRNLILLISLRAYSLAEARDYAAMKTEIAISIRKEKHAEVFKTTDGTVGDKENTAVSETTEEILVATIHSLVASLLKTKVEEAHRIVDALKSVLLSRAQEAKLAAMEKSTRAAYE